MNLEVRIGRLVLEGIALAPEQRPRVQAALEAELARLLAEGGLAPALLAGGALPRLPADSFTLSGDGDPTQLGQQIAQAVYGGLKR